MVLIIPLFSCNCRFVKNFVWFICGSNYYSRHTSTLKQACLLSDEPLGNLAQLLSIGMKEVARWEQYRSQLVCKKTVKRKCWILCNIFCKCLVHSCFSRPLLCCSFLSVCLLCSGVPLTLQCRGFGLSISMLFSLISSEIYPLNTDWGIRGHKLHRDYHSMFEFFFSFWSEHYDLEACCYIYCNL